MLQIATDGKYTSSKLTVGESILYTTDASRNSKKRAMNDYYTREITSTNCTCTSVLSTFTLISDNEDLTKRKN